MIFGIGETKKIEEAYKKGVSNEGNAYSSSRQLAKAISTGYDDQESGGIIVLPVEADDGEVQERVTRRVYRIRKRLIEDGDRAKYGIGTFFDGKYDKDGAKFTPRSLCVEFTGIVDDDLNDIAKALCHTADCGCAIVKRYSDGRARFVNCGKSVDEGYVPLTEASLTHILGKKKYGEGYVVVSACRGDWDEDDRERNNHFNNEKTRELKRAAKEAGFGYVPVYGGFIENFGTDKAKDVFERSLMVFPYSNRGEKRDFSELKDWAKDMGIRFNQDAVLIKEPDENGEAKAPYYLVTADRDGNQIGDRQEWFGKDTYKVNDIAQQYFTSMHKKSRRHEKDDNPRRFSLTESEVGEGCVRVLVNGDPKCYSGAHSRYMAGELFNYSR